MGNLKTKGIILFIVVVILFSYSADARRVHQGDILQQQETEEYKNIEDINDVITVLSIAKTRINWDRVPLYMQRELLQRAADELELSLDKLTLNNLNKSNFDFLEGNSLSSLISYYQVQRNLAKDEFNLIPERFKNIIPKRDLSMLGSSLAFVVVALGLFVPEGYICWEIDELIDLLKETAGDIDWQRVPIPLQHQLLERVAHSWGWEPMLIEEDQIKSKPIHILGDITLESLFNSYNSLLTSVKDDLHVLPHHLRGLMDVDQLPRMQTMYFMMKIVGINWATPLGRKEQWITNYEYLVSYEAWDAVAESQPERIAFYVKELACCVARKTGAFTNLYDLLNDRHYRETAVPSLGRSLASMHRYFQDVFSIMKYLTQHRLIVQIESEVKAELSQ